MEKLPIRLLQNTVKRKQDYIDYFGDNRDMSKTFKEEIIVIENAIKNLELCESQKPEANENTLPIADVINWVFFPEIPNIGDEIVLVYPPEQMMEPMIVIYDRDVEWIDGCKWALITPYL